MDWRIELRCRIEMMVTTALITMAIWLILLFTNTILLSIIVVNTSLVIVIEQAY